MSSYLTFYLLPKAEDSKPLDLISYSRSTGVYQYFNDNLNVAYIGNGEETQYTELTVDDVNLVIEDLKKDINKTKNKVLEYEKQAAGNSEIIEYIIELKEYIEDLEWALYKTEFIRDLVVEATYSYCDYNKVLCNVD